ncbi:MAG: glutathione S-transferase family protein [Sphingomonas sp.]
MKPQLYAHPFSSYCQKVLTALYENGTDFELRMLDPDHPENGRELAELWPIGKFPILAEDGRAIYEATVIVEYLQLRHPGPVRLIPEDPDEALHVRMMDRIFDNYVMTPMQGLVGDSLRPEADRDPYGVAEARAALDNAYGWLDAHLAGRTWAAGEGFSLADCAAAPALFYADWAHPIADRHANLRAYRARLLARPSFARAVDEARPWRAYFPLGAPERD